MRYDTFTQSQCICFPNIDSKAKNNMMEKPGRYHLYQEIEGNILSNDTNWNSAHLIRCNVKNISSLLWYCCRKVKLLSYVWLFVTPWIVAHQAPQSMKFSRQEYWSGLPFPSQMHESEKWRWSHSVMSYSETPWTAAHQAPPSIGFSRQEYWRGLPLPSPQ